MRQPRQSREMTGRQVGEGLLERHHEVLHGPGRALDECRRNHLRTRLDRDRRRAQDVGRSHLTVDVEQRDARAVDRDLDLLALGRHVVAEQGADAREVEREPEDIVTVGRKRMPNGEAAAGTERRARDVPHLRERRRDDVGLDHRRGIRVTDGQSGDLAGGDEIAVQQGWRDRQDVRHVVESLAHVIRREQR